MKGWLDKYQEGGVAKTDATRVAAPALKLTKAQLEKNKAINKQVMANTEKANAKKLAERKKGIAESSEADIINPNGKRFAIGDKFRMFPNDVGGVGEMFDDFINPAVFVGNTASGLGNAMIGRDAGAFATEAGLALGAGALGFDPLGNSGFLESGKEFLSLYKNLSKSKNLNELGQSFFGIPPEKILPRLSKEDLKIYRQVQDIGRMRSMNKPISEQYKFALDQGIPEEHLQKIFKKSKSEIENIIPTTQEREAFRLANPIRLNLERPPRQSTSITERDDIVRNSVSDYDIDRILNQMPPPPEEIIMNDQSFFLGSTTYKNANLSKGINSIPTKLVSSLISHPTYTGEVLEQVPSLYLNNSGTLKNVSDKVFTRSSSGINSGDVFTGSLNTSHNSYLPQLKQVFKYKGGAPQFLGYKPMNSLGYLSEYGYSHKDIAKYLNTEIDEQVNRKIIPENIQRPYIQGEHVLLPHYGIKEFKDGGWLDKYQEGGEVEKPQRTDLFNQDTLSLPKNSYAKYVTDKKKSRLKGTSDDEEIDKAADWLTNWYSSKGAKQRLAESLKTEDPRQVLQDAKDNVNNVYVLRNYSRDSYDDAIIKDKNTDFNALISKSNLLHARISAAKNELKYKTSDGAYTAGFYTPYGHMINITPGIDDKVIKETSVHELTHASNLDKYYNNVGEAILKKHPLGTTNGVGLFPRFKQPKGTNQSDSQYIKKDGAYPRLMEMRYNSKINPNQVITPEQFKTIKKENPKNDLFRYYTDYDIINMLNHFAANDKPIQSDITTAEYGGELNYNDASASAGPGFQGDGYSNVGRNYSPAWGGQFQMGGSLPGATGSMYARVGAPSKGKDRNKLYKTDASAQNGKEMKFYQEGLDFKPKSISKNGSKVIKDDRGQWDHPGEITEIGSNQITMQGVPYPVMGISDTGDMQMMYPNQEYQYDGESVTEYPMMAQGGQLTKLDQLTNFTNYNTKQPGGWLDKYQ